MGVAFLWPRPSAENMPFPKSYLLQEKPSIFFDGSRGHYIDQLLYDLVVEGIVEFVVVRNRSRINVPDHPSRKVKFKKFTRGDSWDECLAAGRSPQLRVSSEVWRSSYDLLRGQCVIVRPVDDDGSDLLVTEDEDFLSIAMRSTGTLIARAPKDPHREQVRALFGDRANISRQAGSKVTEDDFTDADLVRAIETNGNVTGAAISIISRRAQIDDRGVVPEIVVRRDISPEVLKALLRLAPAGLDPAHGYRPGFQALIPGASAETAEIIYSKVVEMLYLPFKASKPHDPRYYGDRWKAQIRARRPDLEAHFVSNDYVPVFAAAHSFRSASALALQLGQPYTGRFYEEFRTEIVNQTLFSFGPSFHTAILAQSEPDIVAIISKIRSQNMSPVRMATVWALIEQGRSLPDTYIEELRDGCEQDPDFLNDPLASKGYLDGETFCYHYFQAEGSLFGQ